MARKIFLKIWSVLISSLALLGADVSSQAKASHAVNAQALWQLPIRKDTKPELFLQQSTTQEESNALFAAHRSHSSHRSHASHSSHVSGVSSRETPTDSSSSPTDTTEKKRTTPSATSVAPTRISDKKIFMKNGVMIPCDSNWISEGRVYCSKDGKSFFLPLEDVDLKKTSIGPDK